MRYVYAHIVGFIMDLFGLLTLGIGVYSIVVASYVVRQGGKVSGDGRILAGALSITMSCGLVLSGALIAGCGAALHVLCGIDADIRRQTKQSATRSKPIPPFPLCKFQHHDSVNSGQGHALEDSAVLPTEDITDEGQGGRTL